MTAVPDSDLWKETPELPLPRSTTRIEEIAQKVSAVMALLAPNLPDAEGGIDEEPTREFARQLYQERRLRDTILPADLFGEPVWDILLDLYASEKEGEPISVNGLCCAAAAAPTTALRYLDALLERGLIVRTPAPEQENTTGVALSPSARSRMKGLLMKMIAARQGRSTAGEEPDPHEQP